MIRIGFGVLTNFFFEIGRRSSLKKFFAYRLAPVVPQNALCSAERRGRINEKGLLESLQMISELPVDIDDGINGAAIVSVVSLARNHGLAAYDAAYLELAIRLGATLCSFDKELIAVAAKLELSLLPLRQLK